LTPSQFAKAERDASAKRAKRHGAELGAAQLGILADEVSTTSVCTCTCARLCRQVFSMVGGDQSQRHTGSASCLDYCTKHHIEVGNAVTTISASQQSTSAIASFIPPVQPTPTGLSHYSLPSPPQRTASNSLSAAPTPSRQSSRQPFQNITNFSLPSNPSLRGPGTLNPPTHTAATPAASIPKFSPSYRTLPFPTPRPPTNENESPTCSGWTVPLHPKIDLSLDYVRLPTYDWSEVIDKYPSGQTFFKVQAYRCKGEIFPGWGCARFVVSCN
ncbi:hypothetical protein P7C70_g9406, partial [Phenoliferia sp. Uapishka_3]